MAEYHGHKIKHIRTDNGFVNMTPMIKICTEAGIVRAKTIHAQLNGVAVRMNWTIVERARRMLAEARLSYEFWAEAIHHAGYLVNQSVNRTVGSQTPKEIWSVKLPNLKDLKIFGNHVVVHVPKELLLKCDKKAKEMIFLGYVDSQLGVRCFDPATGKIIISRYMRFLTPQRQRESIQIYQ